MDGVLIANECIYSRDREREHGLICKLDLEKAFDRVDWEFLQYLLFRMGFGAKWRNLIKECLSSAYFSILINGSPKGFFPAQTSMRQGDLLSPFLFVIVVEEDGGRGRKAESYKRFQGEKNCPFHFSFAVCRLSSSVKLMKIKSETSKPF